MIVRLSRSVLITAILLTMSRSFSLDLVSNGKPVTPVVVIDAAAEENDPAAKKKRKKADPKFSHDDAGAARVLVDWVEKISDAKLEIVSAAPKDGPAIYIGAAAVQAGLKLDGIQSESHEGLRILAQDDRILIAGQNETATIKAVCRFLEELGCRYFMDNSLGEVYPRTPTVSVGKLDISEKPGMLNRNAKGPSWNGPATELWKIWNGNGGTQLAASHSWGGYVHPGSFAEHPEFFAMNKDGQRKEGGWLCTSNPDLREYFASKVMLRIKDGTANPSISPTDGRGYCQCPTCKAQDDPKIIEPSSGTICVTNRYVDFFDTVGKKVAAQYPQSILSFYCYADYTQPPGDKHKLSPNLCAFIAPIRYCRFHSMGNPNCPSRMQEVEMIDGWAGTASKLGYYCYNYNLAECTVPLSMCSVWKHDLPILKSKGCVALTIEVISNWHIYGPQIYQALRLAYNPAVDADALMDDYCTKFYGPDAGPLMKQYWQGIDQAQLNVKCHSGSFFGIRHIYTADFQEKCSKLLEAAVAAAKNDRAYSERVALHAEGFKSAQQYMQIESAMASGDFTRAKTIYDALLLRINALMDKRYANREYGTSYLQRFLSKQVERGAIEIAAPNKLISVLPDRWQFTWDNDGKGEENGFAKVDFDDSKWQNVATFSATLDAQGIPDKETMLWYRTQLEVPEAHGDLALFFDEIDGSADVYVNGQKVGSGVKKHEPFDVDVTAALHAGKNSVAVRVDHSKMTELFLGGIVRPVLLVEKGK